MTTMSATANKNTHPAMNQRDFSSRLWWICNSHCFPLGSSVSQIFTHDTHYEHNEIGGTSLNMIPHQSHLDTQQGKLYLLYLFPYCADSRLHCTSARLSIHLMKSFLWYSALLFFYPFFHFSLRFSSSERCGIYPEHIRLWLVGLPIR